MARSRSRSRKWNELSPGARRVVVVVVGGSVEAVLKVVALADLARRPAAQVRGPKWRWALAIVVVNAFGAVPLAYFRWGRRQGT